MAAHQSQLVLLKLLLLLTLLHHCKPWGTNNACYQARRFRNGTKELTGLKVLLDGWNIPAAGEKPIAIPCLKAVSCQTFRCRDMHENDLFVVNACSEVHNECSEQLKDECKTIAFQMGGYSPWDCSTCYKDKCNEKELDLEVKEVVTTTEPPGENLCAHSSRYDEYNERVRPPDGYFELMKKWQIERPNKGKKLLSCYWGAVGCQTYRCKYENGDDHFVVNACAEKDGQCNKELKEFCKKPLQWHCDPPCKKNKCNNRKSRIERETPSLSTTTSTTKSKKAEKVTMESGATPGGDGGGGGGVTSSPPTARSKLECLVEKICDIWGAKGLVKLSRRFTFRAKELDSNCKELLCYLREDPQREFDKEIENSFKENQHHGRLFLADFLRVIDYESGMESKYNC